MTARTAKDFVALTTLAAADLDMVAGGWIGYDQNAADTTGITTETDICTVTCTVGANRRLLVVGQATLEAVTADVNASCNFYEDATGLGKWFFGTIEVGDVARPMGFSVQNPTSGSHTYKLSVARSSGTGTITCYGSAGQGIAKLLIVDLGTAS